LWLSSAFSAKCAVLIHYATVVLAAAPPRPPAPAPSGGLKERAAATTLYLMPSDHRRLRKLAIDRDVSMQTLLLDAIDLLMAQENEAPVERWETRRKR
jgi:hypothetical protein